jgi:CDP-glycerol glycerophosphotransferase
LLDTKGSDIACGGVLRFSPAAIWASPAHKEIFTANIQRTYASLAPILLQDRTPWNPIYRFQAMLLASVL